MRDFDYSRIKDQKWDSPASILLNKAFPLYALLTANMADIMSIPVSFPSS